MNGDRKRVSAKLLENEIKPATKDTNTVENNAFSIVKRIPNHC